MFEGRLPLFTGVQIEYHLMRFFYGRTMRSVDADFAEFTNTVSSNAIHAKTATEIAHTFDLYANSILRLSYSYLHNKEDAEDILQETLLQYMLKGPVFKDSAHKKAWLLRVAANLSKNKINYNQVRKVDQLSEELIAKERTDLSFVWEAVKSLTLSQREVIHLFYQEGYSTAEIAKLLKEKESTVRSHLKRGRDKLKEVLKEEYDFE